MDSKQRILEWLLRIGGAVMLLALIPVVMPFSWMNLAHQQMGLGELPNVPIVGYLTRSASALYALHGALLLFLASDLRCYLPVVRFLAIAEIGFGAVLLGIDCFVGMPLSWTLGEGPFVIAYNILILWLSGRKSR